MNIAYIDEQIRQADANAKKYPHSKPEWEAMKAKWEALRKDAARDLGMSCRDIARACARVSFPINERVGR